MNPNQNEIEAFLDTWTSDLKQWHVFREEKFKEDKKDAWISGRVLGIVFVVVAVLITFREGWSTIAIWTISALIIGQVLGTLMMLNLASKEYSKNRKTDRGQIQFGKEKIIINGELVPLKGLGLNLQFFGREEKFGMEVLSIRIRASSSSGNRGTHRHYFPFPKEETNWPRIESEYQPLVNTAYKV